MLWCPFDSKITFLTNLFSHLSPFSIFICVCDFFFISFTAFRVCYFYSTGQIIEDCSNLAFYMHTLQRCCTIFFMKIALLLSHLFIENKQIRIYFNTLWFTENFNICALFHILLLFLYDILKEVLMKKKF